MCQVSPVRAARIGAGMSESRSKFISRSKSISISISISMSESMSRSESRSRYKFMSKIQGSISLYIGILFHAECRIR